MSSLSTPTPPTSSTQVPKVRYQIQHQSNVRVRIDKHGETRCVTQPTKQCRCKRVSEQKLRIHDIYGETRYLPFFSKKKFWRQDAAGCWKGLWTSFQCHLVQVHLTARRTPNLKVRKHPPLSSINVQQTGTGRPVMLVSSSNSSEWNNDDKWSSQVRRTGVHTILMCGGTWKMCTDSIFLCTVSFVLLQVSFTVDNGPL